MKKLISTLSALSLTIPSISSVASCNADYGFDGIVLITGEERVKDNSFNQVVYEGICDYIQNYINIKNKKEPRYYEPKNKDELLGDYKTAYETDGTKAVVLNSYIHNVEGEAKYEDYAENKDISSVIMDSTSAGKKSIGVEFRSDVSGFYAGMSSIIWSIMNNNYDEDEKELVMGTYGGIISSAQASVTSYMEGFYSAIYVWNKLTPQFQSSLIEAYGNNEDLSKFIDGKYTVKRAQSNDPTSDTDPEYASGSFTVGEGINITKKLIVDDKCNVIMPVAGRQLEDTLLLIRNKYSDLKLMVDGVDSDCTDLYSGYKGRIITSGLKKLDLGAIIALTHTNAYVDDTNVKSKFLSEMKTEDNKKIQVTLDDDTTAVDWSNINNYVSWEGKNIWISGDISHGGDNLISDDDYDILLKLFPYESIMAASYKYMKDATGDNAKSSSDLLAESYIESQADLIINSVSQINNM